VHLSTKLEKCHCITLWNTFLHWSITIHHAVPAFSPRLNKSWMQLVHIVNLYLVYTLLHHAPADTVIRVRPRRCFLCLVAQKLDCVMNTTCWCIVLLEHKHISSNAADRWQQFLHQRHFSIISNQQVQWKRGWYNRVSTPQQRRYGLAERRMRAQKTWNFLRIPCTKNY